MTTASSDGSAPRFGPIPLSGKTPSRDQQQLTRRLPRFEGPVAVGRVLEPLAAGQAPHLGLEVLFGIDDDVGGAGFARELRLLVRRYRADDARAAHFRDLAEEQSHATRRRVDEASVALLQWIGAAREV